MAGVVVSLSRGVMDSVIAKLTEPFGDTCANLLGVSEDIQFLRDELLTMNALLKTLEDNEQLDLQMKSWRNQVIEMTYDIEDCIDNFKNNMTSDKDRLISKFSCFVTTLRACFGTAMQIKKIKTRLQDINDRRKRYKVDGCASSALMIETVDPRLSALYNEPDSLVGIDNPKEDLIKWVLDEDRKLKMVSIVGAGGLGKTTLANEVCREIQGQGGSVEITHDRRFTCKVFVPISHTPDWSRILTNILSQLGNNISSSDYDLQSIIGILRQCLQDTRYLFIVDDLWSVRDWNNIRCAFPPNNQGSRVIVTTRDVEVARACCSDSQYIHYMKPLSDANSRTLFLKRISISQDFSHSENSEVVVSEILKKCGGLPLAIITIASILACQGPGRLKEKWECIQNSITIQSAINPTLEVMEHILDLSYRSLPHELKPCFLYLGKYPEDHRINRNDLVRQWVAEGFVRSHSDRDVWNIAEGYFNGLLNRSMIQPVYDCYNLEVSACRVHDMVLDLILKRCREDNFMTVVSDLQEVAKVQHKIRRLSMDMRDKEDVTMTKTSTGPLSQVRSLAMFGGPVWIPPLLDFKFIRVLFLEYHRLFIYERMVDLTCIIQLSQLRYLKINSFCRFPESKIVLPSQIGRLQHMETLEFSCSSSAVVSIPSNIVDLPHLCHLIVPSMTVLPDGIGKVISLQTLHGFDLVRSSSENIRDLGALTNLVDLELFLYYGGTNSESTLTKTYALSSALKNLSRLKRIYVGSSIYSRSGDLSFLSPPFRNLEVLKMHNVTFPRVPMWIGSLFDLRELHLRVDEISNFSWEDVGIIGTLPSLVYLSLWTTGVPAERILIKGFQALQKFKFCCNSLSHVSFEAGAMPNLRELELQFYAHEWDKAAPAGLEHLTSLKTITAYDWISSTCTNARHRDVFQKAVDALPTRPALLFR